jgi:hypothetical protein
MEATLCYETSVLTRATRRNITDDGILRSEVFANRVLWNWAHKFPKCMHVRLSSLTLRVQIQQMWMITSRPFKGTRSKSPEVSGVEIITHNLECTTTNMPWSFALCSGDLLSTCRHLWKDEQLRVSQSHELNAETRQSIAENRTIVTTTPWPKRQRRSAVGSQEKPSLVLGMTSDKLLPAAEECQAAVSMSSSTEQLLNLYHSSLYTQSWQSFCFRLFS